jgi:hypothetical protein
VTVSEPVGSKVKASVGLGTPKCHAKGFARKADAQDWLNQQVSDQVTGTWTDPALSGGYLREHG